MISFFLSLSASSLVFQLSIFSSPLFYLLFYSFLSFLLSCLYFSFSVAPSFSSSLLFHIPFACFLSFLPSSLPSSINPPPPSLLPYSSFPLFFPPPTSPHPFFPSLSSFCILSLQTTPSFPPPTLSFLSLQIFSPTFLLSSSYLSLFLNTSSHSPFNFSPFLYSSLVL